jgi:hypothetical protein
MKNKIRLFLLIITFNFLFAANLKKEEKYTRMVIPAMNTPMFSTDESIFEVSTFGYNF